MIYDTAVVSHPDPAVFRAKLNRLLADYAPLEVDLQFSTCQYEKYETVYSVLVIVRKEPND